MVQFKPYFTGRAVAPAPRLTSVQRCFRTTDIDTVGDVSHHTFFEMLGNFSVGDYFKADAIPWAWEFITGELGIPKERLWNTVFTDDDEAFDLWVKVGQKPERIYRYGEAEGNFWGPPGAFGPCGPCSEIFYDWGEEFGCGPDCEPAHECFRFLEIWNLVFMAMYQDESGQANAACQGEHRHRRRASIASLACAETRHRPYETDLFSPIMRLSRAKSAGVRRRRRLARHLRVIADHGRAITFLIAEACCLQTRAAAMSSAG